MSTSVVRRSPLLLASLAMVLGWVLFFATPAGAHATLLEMHPQSETTLDAPPDEVRLTFSEEITATPDSIRVFDPAAAEIGGVAATTEGPVLSAELPELETIGSYTVAWKATSADGHPVSGAYLFHVGEPTLSEPVDAGLPAGSGPANVLRALGAVLALSGLAVSVVSGAARVRGEPGPDWWGLRWLAAVAGTVLLFSGAVVAVGSSLSPSIKAVLQTDSGRMGVIAVALSLFGLVASRLPVHPRVDVVLGLLTATAVALQGHAVSLAPVLLSALGTWVHVLAAVVWAAGLFWVEHRSRSASEEELQRDVLRLSPWGMGMVIALAVSGGWLLLDRVPLDELLSSTYGRLGLVKVAALVVAVLLAWRNRRSVQAAEVEGQGTSAVAVAAAGERGAVALASAPSGTRADLQRWVRIEMVVLAVALIAGAALAQVPPPGLDGMGADFFAERQPFGEGEVEMTFEPNRRGVNEVHIVALAPDGRLNVDAGTPELALELPDQDVGPIEPEMQPVSGGHSMTYVRVPFEGTWVATVTARVDQFTELRATFEVPIRR